MSDKKKETTAEQIERAKKFLTPERVEQLLKDALERDLCKTGGRDPRHVALKKVVEEKRLKLRTYPKWWKRS